MNNCMALELICLLYSVIVQIKYNTYSINACLIEGIPSRHQYLNARKRCFKRVACRMYISMYVHVIWRCIYRPLRRRFLLTNKLLCCFNRLEPLKMRDEIFPPVLYFFSASCILLSIVVQYSF